MDTSSEYTFKCLFGDIQTNFQKWKDRNKKVEKEIEKKSQTFKIEKKIE